MPVRRLLLWFLWGVLALRPASAGGQNVVISEFLAINTSTLVDGDGDTSDWIEICNRDAAVVSLDGWHLTDDPGDRRLWRLPAVDLEPGGYLVVFASGKDRGSPGAELHANFRLEGEGEYLALVRPDGSLATQFAPRFPPQRSDVSFGLGERTVGDHLVVRGDLATVLVPADSSLGLSWTGGEANEPFDDSAAAGWRLAPTGIGYPADGVPEAPFPIAYWHFDGSPSDATGNGHTGVLNGATFSDERPALLGAGQSLRFDGSNDFVSATIDVSETSYTSSFWFKTQAGARGLFTVVENDLGDGGHDRHVYLSAGNLATRVWSNETISTSGRNFADGSWHHVAHVVGSQIGGQRIYVDGQRVASGSKAISDFDWQRRINIGFSNDAANPFFSGHIDDVALWSDVLSEAEIEALAQGALPLALSGYAPFIESDVESEMRGASASIYIRIPFDVDLPVEGESLRLRMRYDDGFVAYLNGAEVARRNAPAQLTHDSSATSDRPAGAAIRQESIDLTDHLGLLREGTNVLAIHGLNDERDSADFLILPELVWMEAIGDRYFEHPTPGAPNDAAGVAGYVSDTRFSVDRGIFSQAFAVEITTETEDAEIRYTLDGSEPTSTHGTLYSGPIPITGTTILRAAAFKPDLGPTNVDTQTYIFPADVVHQPVMLRDITGHAVYGPLVEPALVAIPSISIVTPGSINPSSEVKASVELLYPDQSDGFQIDAGVKKVGGHSLNYPKNNMRLYFRREYGDAKLEYPVFEGLRYGEGAAGTFDQLNLRSGSHDSVFYLGVNQQPPSNAQYLRNRWINDVQLEMGQLSLHGRFVHVYINGVYWGHYHLMERPTRSYMASYLGGEKEEYEAVNSGRTIGPQSPAWTHIASIRGDYEEVKRWVDVSSLVDYMLLNFYAGNAWDWFTNHNWMAAGPSSPDSGGYRFFNWDSDIILRRTNDYNLNQGGPGSLFRDLLRHAEFRLLLADRIHRHFHNDGLLTPERVQELYDLRAQEIFPTIIAETARWRWDGVVWTRDNQWQAELNRLRNDFFPRRTDIVMDQIRSVGWYPDVAAPVFRINGREQHGGLVDSGDQLTVSVPGLRVFVDTPVVTRDDPVTVHVPVNGDLADEWRLPGYVEGSHGEAWRTGTGGVGYEHQSGYESVIGVDVGPQMTGEPGSTGVYVRLPFTVRDEAALASMGQLTLKVLYDDGFAAYLNGARVAAANAPEEGMLEWNSRATGAAEARIDTPEAFEVESAGDHLRIGQNLLAIHGLNFSPSSSDMLILAELVDRRLEPGLPPGTVFYTVDSTDPMAADALEYTAPVALTETILVKARAFDGSEWSALNEALYVVPGSYHLRVTEIMYHPPDAPLDSPYQDEDFEFIELQNTGGRALDLAGVRIQGGIDFDFSTSPVSSLAPGAYVLVVSDLEAFSTRYDTTAMAIAGEYARRLSNGGDTLVVTGPLGETVLAFGYDDEWYPSTDGAGSSLFILDPFGPPDSWNLRESWWQSGWFGGSPGAPEEGLEQGGLQRPGDSNQDGVLDISDAVRLLRLLFGDARGAPPCDGAGLNDGGNRTLLDSNGDGSVDISDVVWLLGFLFQNGAPPAAGTRCMPIEGCLWSCRF